MGKARSKAAPQLTVVPEPEPEPTPAVAAPDGPREVVEARVGKALQDAFANPLDWSAPCSQTVPRPRPLEGRTIQGRKAGDLFCNRPGNHQGPHRVYSADFHVLAEVPR